jgi:hypothetical protein
VPCHFAPACHRRSQTEIHFHHHHNLTTPPLWYKAQTRQFGGHCDGNWPGTNIMLTSPDTIVNQTDVSPGPVPIPATPPTSNQQPTNVIAQSQNHAQMTTAAATATHCAMRSLHQHNHSETSICHSPYAVLDPVHTPPPLPLHLPEPPSQCCTPHTHIRRVTTLCQHTTSLLSAWWQQHTRLPD